MSITISVLNAITNLVRTYSQKIHVTVDVFNFVKTVQKVAYQAINESILNV